MESIIVLAIGAPIALAIWLIVRAVNARSRIEELSRRLGELELEVLRLKQPPWPGGLPAETSAPPIRVDPPLRQPDPVRPQPPPPPPAFDQPAHEPAPEFSTAEPPPILSEAIETPAPASPPKFKPAIDWEQFMGVKGFAWVGGFALFLGVAFFIKYSFDNNLVPPELRVAIGFLAGISLLVGGVVMSRRNFPALAQTLCATGVVVLYAVTFACRSIYHFEFFNPVLTFLLMALITTAAFLLAARLNALVVAILGMLGGFLTPILLSTGHDNPLGLFGYIAILDTGLILVALNRRWYFLTALAALGTVVMEIGWVDKFFTDKKYFAGNKIFVALAVLLGFNALYLAANWWANRRSNSNTWLTGANLGLVAAALGFTGFFLTFAPLAQRPGLMFGFVFLVDLVVPALTRFDQRVEAAQPLAGLAVFGLLTFWTTQSLTNELLNAALACYFIFAVFHSLLPVLPRNRRSTSTTLPPEGGDPEDSRSAAFMRPSRLMNHLFPPLALLLVLVPIFKLPATSFIVWPFVLLVDLLAILLAALTATLIPVLVILVLTLAATGVMIFKLPATLTGLPASFFLLGAFAVFFVVASVWLVRRVKPDLLKSGLNISGDVANPETLAALLPASSAVLPFLLLIMAALRLPLTNPTPLFGLALLLVVLLLGLTKLFSMQPMPLIGLAGLFSLECVWHFNRFDVTNQGVSPTLPLTWYLIFFGVFAVFPFLFRRQFSEKTLPWTAAALAGPAQFFLIFRLVKVAWPNPAMGLLSAAFALPALISLVIVIKTESAANPARLARLAWFGGVALFFITLIFPIQFSRQWITLGWALEGAALLWLFHRVPHPGLQLTGFGLLIAAFVRLAFNPAVLEYHQRSHAPILNWYLYTYGVAIASLFAGARLLAPPRNMVWKANAQPILATLGTVLSFLLMNIEIADYFSAPGSTLDLEFGGNFAREMTYTIAWALFALVMIFVGIAKEIAAARYAAIALLCVTLLKLFFYDLAHLDPRYRIGAFIGVAVVAMLASFAYQKFFTRRDKTPAGNSADQK